jgi:hypothetical protein
MKSAILLQKMPNGVDEGMTLGLPNVVIVACFCRVVWIFREILDDVTRRIYTLSSTNGEYMFLANQDEFLFEPSEPNNQINWVYLIEQ